MIMFHYYYFWFFNSNAVKQQIEKKTNYCIEKACTWMANATDCDGINSFLFYGIDLGKRKEHK